MDLSDNRRTALALVLAILAVRMLLNGRVQSIWAALWGPRLGLGTEALLGMQAGPPAGGTPGIGTSATTTATTTMLTTAPATTPTSGSGVQTF